MANGYFERGEIYWVRMDNGFGGEQGVGRPGVIVSANAINNKHSTVTIAFMSKQPHPNLHYIAVDATGVTSYIVCNQVMTYDKTRLGKHIGTLNREEVKALDDAMEEVFDLGYVDDGALKEKDKEIAARNAVIAEKDREIETLKAEIAAMAQKHENETLSYRVESEMFQKLYDKVLTQLVDMKFTNDLFLRREVPVVKMAEPKPEERVEPEVPEEPEQPDDRVDINHCTITALKKLGFSLPMAKKITECRPFKDVLDLKRVPGLKATQFRIMEPKLCCTPIVEEQEIVSALPEPDAGCETPKVNINAASAREISEAIGLHISTCSSISGYRNKNGPYEKLEDLLNVRGIYPGTLEKIKDKIEFGEVPAPAAPAVEGKVNVNTANARQLTLLTGLNQKSAQGVVRYRKEHGPFASLDDLLNVPEFGVTCMARFRDKLEV